MSDQTSSDEIPKTPSQQAAPFLSCASRGRRSPAPDEGETMRYREVIRTLEDGSQVYSNLMPTPGGGEFEMVRATYRRI